MLLLCDSFSTVLSRCLVFSVCFLCSLLHRLFYISARQLVYSKYILFCSFFFFFFLLLFNIFSSVVLRVSLISIDWTISSLSFLHFSFFTNREFLVVYQHPPRCIGLSPAPFFSPLLFLFKPLLFLPVLFTHYMFFFFISKYSDNSFIITIRQQISFAFSSYLTVVCWEVLLMLSLCRVQLSKQMLPFFLIFGSHNSSCYVFTFFANSCFNFFLFFVAFFQ